MKNGQTAKHSDRLRFGLGDRVRLRFGAKAVTGTIVEDRGRIGIRGRRLLRVRVNIDSGQETFVEVPVDELHTA